MKYNDFELLELIYDNDEVAYNIMLNKYKPIIYSKALEYYNYLKTNSYECFSLDDFFQEGIIAFNHAIKNFDVNKGTLFYSFFLVCLTSNFNLMYRSVFTLKNKPLLNYKELDYEIRDSAGDNPYDIIDELDLYNKLNNYLYSISIEDAAIITLRLNNFKYYEIVKLLEVSSSHISRVIRSFKEKFDSINTSCNLL